MKTVTVARNAMATRFELVVHGTDEIRLRAAAESALDEIDRVEAQLSCYRPASQISHLNAHAASGPVRVDPALFDFLDQALRLHRLTDGAFDPTIGPLMRCWGFTRGEGRVPAPDELEAARQVTGMHWIELDPSRFTVRFRRAGVAIDPGAIGKGYAIEAAAEILIEAGVQSALIHGGTSTVRALGSPPDSDAWRVALPRPRWTVGQHNGHDSPRSIAPAVDRPLAVVSLRDNAVSVSAVWGRIFETEAGTIGHVLDPRRGEPVRGAVMSAVITKSATVADAFSTALLVLGFDGQERLRAAAPDLQSLVATITDPPESALAIRTFGDGWVTNQVTGSSSGTGPVSHLL
jgi:FAD:protein FMN transferase